VTLRVVVDALGGLGAAHDLTGRNGKHLGLVHRDVSPHNINGRPRRASRA